MEEHMKEFICRDGLLPGPTVRAPEKCCLFCEHCVDILWDYTSGPYFMMCEIRESCYPEGFEGKCSDFKEESEE